MLLTELILKPVFWGGASFEKRDPCFQGL